MNHDYLSISATPSHIPPHLLSLGSTERWIDDELAQSFPASDPPSWTMGTAKPQEPDDEQRRRPS